MRIAMIGHKRIPSREGGIEIVIEELATRMVEKGYSVTCFNRKGRHVSGGEVKKLKEYKGVRIKEVFTIDRKGLAAMTSSLCACLRASFGGYDVVHIHAEGPAFFSFLPHLMHKKVVVTIHGLDWDRAKWNGFAKWYIKQGEKNAVKFADQIIVLSQGVKEYFLKEYRRETKFIPNGVNRLEIKKADAIKKWGLKKVLWPMALSLALPCSVFLYLGMAQPESIWLISACVALDQFGYGFGFTAYMLYLIMFSEGEFKTAHYSLCTAFMAMSMMIPGMFAGYLQEWLGYVDFFWMVMVCCLATVAVTAFVKVDPAFGKKHEN